MKQYKFKATIEPTATGEAYVLFPSDTKKEETRIARSAKAIEMLRKGVKTPG